MAPTVGDIREYLSRFDGDSSLDNVLQNEDLRSFFKSVYELLKQEYAEPSARSQKATSRVTEQQEQSIQPSETILEFFRNASAHTDSFWTSPESQVWTREGDTCAILEKAYAANCENTADLKIRTLRKRMFAVFFYLAARQLDTSNRLTKLGRERLRQAICLSGRLSPSTKEVNGIIDEGLRYRKLVVDTLRLQQEPVNADYGVVLILPEVEGVSWTNTRTFSKDDYGTVIAHLRSIKILETAGKSGATDVTGAVLGDALAPISWFDVEHTASASQLSNRSKLPQPPTSVRSESTTSVLTRAELPMVEKNTLPSTPCAGRPVFAPLNRGDSPLHQRPVSDEAVASTEWLEADHGSCQGAEMLNHSGEGTAAQVLIQLHNDSALETQSSSTDQTRPASKPSTIQTYKRGRHVGQNAIELTRRSKRIDFGLRESSLHQDRNLDEFALSDDQPIENHDTAETNSVYSQHAAVSLSRYAYAASSRDDDHTQHQEAEDANDSANGIAQPFDITAFPHIHMDTFYNQINFDTFPEFNPSTEE